MDLKVAFNLLIFTLIYKDVGGFIMSRVEIRERKRNPYGFREIRPDMFAAKVDDLLIACFYRVSMSFHIIDVFFKKKSALDKPLQSGFALFLPDGAFSSTERPPNKYLIHIINSHLTSELINLHNLAK